jgi:hypothetical protein
MMLPILALPRSGRCSRNSLTQQSLVLRRCEISRVAVPESIPAREAGSTEKMEPSKEINASFTRFLRTIEASRPRGAEWS